MSCQLRPKPLEKHQSCLDSTRGYDSQCTSREGCKKVSVGNEQAGKLITKAHALRGVYSKLLKGASRREAFEESAEFLEMAVGTIKQWELEYRTKDHIVVSAMISLLYARTVL